VTLGTTDLGGFSASSTLSSNVSFTMTESLVTLTEGSAGRTSALQFSLTTSASVSFQASYQLYESTGSLASYGRDNVTRAVAMSSGGNGEKLDAGGGFGMFGNAETTIWLDASATYTDGSDVQDSDITGSAGFRTRTTSSGGVVQSISYDSQSSSGIPGTDSETYDYISLSFADSAAGSNESSIDVEFSLDDPATTTTTTTTTMASLSSTPPDDGVDFEVTHNDNGSTTFSLLVDSRSPTQFNPWIDGKYYTIVSVNSEMTISASAGMSVTEGAFGIPMAGITNSGQINGKSTTSVAVYDQYNPGNVAPEGFDIRHQATLWITTNTETWTINSNWNFTVGISVLRAPAISGSWKGDLTWEADYLSESTGTTTYADQVTGIASPPETYYAYEQGMWSNSVNGSVSPGGGTLNFSGVTEEWTSGSVSSPPLTLIASPDPWTQALDDVQFALDIAGMVPIVGEAADLINVGIHAGRGNWTDVAISGAAAVPFLGWFATGGKFLKKAAGKVDDAGGVLISKADDLAAEAVRLCFPAGVLINTESGHKGIETVEAGERVWAYDVVTSDWRLCRVLQTFERDYEGDSVFVTVDGETIESTFRHPYWVVDGADLDDRPFLDHHVAAPENATTPGRWVDAGDLQTGDILLLRDGRQVPVESIDTKPVVQKVYNFEVEELHNYGVGHIGILVHNNNGDEAAASWKSVSQFGHTFSTHGEGSRNTRNLLGRAGGTGQSQGQWLNNQQAAEFLDSVKVDGPALIKLPDGLGQVIGPDGSITSATWARVVPSASGIRTAFPILP
jgi:hypothetical protein